MDKKQAKFLLHSFRPDGADAGDADFKEALQLAVEDRELGEWLADERAADSEFAAALADIEIPETLRLSLLSVMRGESLDDPAEYEEMDHLLQQALADVTPPAGLRDQILAAMEVEQNARQDDSEDKIVPMPFNARKWMSVAAVAAALVLGAFLAFQVDIGAEKKALATNQIQQAAVELLSEGVSFDVADSDSTHLTSWLADHDLPAPASLSELPAGLREMKSRGCTKMQLGNGKVASLVCFVAGEQKTAHLVIVRNEDVSDLDLPTMDNVAKKDCYTCPVSLWNYIRWKDSKHTFILMAKQKAASQSELVSYF
ncbi:hypothetical protein JIN77_05530 [Verrucomicrobiaceae bacterium R5-34]|nr:hypothetical protein [Verrucomicrobiaceae bacterium R5-34]